MRRTRTQWRFMWRHATGDENGAVWRDEPPTADEVAEWREDFADVWVEKRTVVEYPPERDTAFDAPVAASDKERE